MATKKTAPATRTHDDEVRVWLQDTTWYDRLLSWDTSMVSAGREFKLHGRIPYLGITTAMARFMLRKRPNRLRDGLGKGRSGSVTTHGPYGAQLGSLVHEEMEHMIKLGDRRAFADLHEGAQPHVLTERILWAELKQEGLQPVKAEFTVHDPQIRLAARLDGVSLKQSGLAVFMERKTQFDHTWDRQDPRRLWRARSGLGGHSCTPMDQACVQVGLAAVMALRYLRHKALVTLDATTDPRQRTALVRELEHLVVDRITAAIVHAPMNSAVRVIYVPKATMRFLAEVVYPKLMANMQRAAVAKSASAKKAAVAVPIVGERTKKRRRSTDSFMGRNPKRTKTMTH